MVWEGAHHRRSCPRRSHYCPRECHPSQLDAGTLPKFLRRLWRYQIETPLGLLLASRWIFVQTYRVSPCELLMSCFRSTYNSSGPIKYLFSRGATCLEWRGPFTTLFLESIASLLAPKYSLDFEYPSASPDWFGSLGQLEMDNFRRLYTVPLLLRPLPT